MKTPSRFFSSGVRIVLGLIAAAAISSSMHLANVSAQTPGQLPQPIPGRNVNMVSGTAWVDGDPFLQRQNEPSIAVSTRNPLHILGAANDYRTVDIPGLGDEVNGDAWIGIFKSFDGGMTWKSTLLPGFRQDATGHSSPLYGLEAAADPVLRAGTNGLFYMAGMAFNRDQEAGKVFVSRFIDNNNLEAGDSIAYLSTTVVDTGTQTRFLDKPWIAVDIPRAMKGAARTDQQDQADRAKNKDKKDPGFDPRKIDTAANPGLPKKPTTGPVCRIPGQAQPIPAGNIYVVYSAFFELEVPPATDKPKTERERELEREAKLGKKRTHEEWEEHKQGVPMEGRTKIMLARSTDCGATFGPPHQISDRSQINQGAVMAIDPNTGDLYVAWREFLSKNQPDALLVSKSTDGGQTFSTPVTIARIHPFDQNTTATSFRTNSYPAMAIDATGRVYVAWAERGIGPGGDARIVISTSTNGTTWSTAVPADNPNQRGHQIQPVLTFGGGRLHLVFWDQRDDVSKMWGEFIDDYTAVNWPGEKARQPKRHTLDLRAAAAWPGAVPQWGPSAKISNYLEGVLPGKTARQQLQFNAPNLPLFSLGTKPFIGDYLDVTVAPAFLTNGDGTWRFNTLASDPATYFTAWGDNRDVRAPKDNNWVHYTPPTFAGYTGTSVYDPTQPVEMCKPGQAGMRDQNVYSAKVSSGLIVTTPGNNKRLGTVTDANGTRLLQRTFVVSVSNPDEKLVKSIVLHITAQPPGGVASFLQFAPLFDLPVDIAPKSSISREVFVTSTDPAATVPVTVTEGTSSTAAARLYLNPDATNPDIDNPDIDNPDIDNPDIDNAEAHAITVSNPTVSNPDIDNISTVNPDIDNPDIDNPDIDNSLLANISILNPDIDNPDIDNPDIDNPDIDNPDIVNPDIDNPDIDNPDIDNAALTDVTWNVSNVGNTATSYQVKVLLKQAQQQRLLNAGVKFQLVVTKTTAAPTVNKYDKCQVIEPNRNLTVVTINSPSFVDPTNAQQVSTIINPDIDNPDIDNATVALAPGDTARVTLRVYSPMGDTAPGSGGGQGSPDPLADLTGALEDLKKVGVATTSHPVDTQAVNAGETTPVIEASIPLIITEKLDDATRGLAFTDAIEHTGATGTVTYSIVTGALPLGLTLNTDGTIVGTPQVSGVFTFTVRLKDANDMYASATLTLRVFDPVVVVLSPLPGANVNQPYAATLSATGGFPPYLWSLAGGSLPAGVSLTPTGALAGTPTQSGSFNFTARAVDSAAPAKFAIGAFVLNVTAAANAQSVTVVEDTATPITVSGTGSGPFTFAIGNTPAHGTLTGTGPVFTYTPDANYNGPDSFTFSATEGSLTSAFATVSINVTAVNDAPTATPKTVNTPQGVAIPIVLTGTDPENSPLTFSIVSNPANNTGTLSGTAPNITYTPPSNGFTGTATFTFRVNDGSLFSPAATVSVIVGPPPANSADVTLTLVDAPDPAALGGSITYTATLHNNGPATATGVTLNLAYPMADLLRQSVVPSQGTCGTANPIVCTIGSIPNGGDVTVAVTLKAFNRGGTFTVTSTAAGTLLDYNTSNNAASQATVVNGPPVATTDLSVSQTSLPNPVAFGSNVVYTVIVTNNGPSDASGVTLSNTFTSNTAQFVGSTASQGSCAAGPTQLICSVDDLAGGASATYTITLKANGSGSLSNTALVTGSQSDSNAANNTHTLATAIANRVPTAANDPATTNEDLAARFTVLGNDTDPDNDTLTVTSVGAAAHGTTQLSGTDGVLYTPASDYFGPDSFTYQISDGRGGIASATVNVNVLSVNDAPSFTKGANQSVGENSGPRTVAGWATAIGVGPLNEQSQTVNFVVSNNNHFLFSAQPAVAPNGTLTFTPAPSGTGTAIVTVTAVDDGGTDNGGIDSSASQTFTISVSSSNDAPTFTMGPNQTVSQNAALQTVPNWATNISAGPPDEAGQALDFIVTTNDGALFDALPAISPTGTLSYQPKAGRAGVATVTVRLHDDGGSNPGVDTSAASTFLISIIPTTTAEFVVTNTNDSGSGSLRAAITAANASQFDDTVRFDIPGSGPFTIQPITALPSITSPLLLDATTQPGFTGTPIVQIDGTNAGSTAHGLQVQTNGTTIRGFVINRFAADGINIAGANNLVAGNYIGTNVAGTAALPNGGSGVYVFGAPNTIGGNTAADRNVLSGNGMDGVLVENTVTAGNVIKGNYIGTNAAGTDAVGNGRWGVTMAQSNSTTVGGDTAAERNLISGNAYYGVHVYYCGNLPACAGHTIKGNYVGTNATGDAAIPNRAGGVRVTYAPNNTIHNNLISGNGDLANLSSLGHGISIQGTWLAIDPDAETHYGNQVVTANRIGTAINGTDPLPNTYFGVQINGSAKARIGGPTPQEGNIIAFNTRGAMAIGGDPSTNTIIEGNSIFNNQVVGVQVADAITTKITRNSIYNNGGLGIELGFGPTSGVTPNDPGDTDTGSNNFQNYPELQSAISQGVATVVTGSINGAPNRQFTIEFFVNDAADISGYGEGQQYLASTTISTDGTGVATFTTPLPPQPAGKRITTTATDPDGNTSEFSIAIAVTNNTPPTATDDFQTVYTGSASTIHPASNDTDPDVASPSILRTFQALAPTQPQLTGPGDVAIVNQTGIGYFTGGGVSAASPAKLAFLDLATNTITGTYSFAAGGGSSLTRVNQSTRIVYMRMGTSLVAIDGRPESATFNKTILALQLGNIQSMALNEPDGTLYLTVLSNPTGNIQNARVVAIDVDPASPTFHEVVGEIVAPNGSPTGPVSIALAQSVGVNTATNKIYAAFNGGASSGVNVIDGNTGATTVVANTPGVSTLAVNQANNMIYAVAGSSLYAIDGNNLNTPRVLISLPATASTGSIDTRLAIHQGTGKVFVRLAEFPSASRLLVIDGNRASATFNQIVSTIVLGREDGQTILAIDETANRLIATSRSDLKTHVINVLNNTIVNTIQANQGVTRATIDTVNHRAYVSGAQSYLQVINLNTGALIQQIFTGVIMTNGDVNPVNHTIYLPTSGVTTDITRVSAAGLQSPIAIASGAGQLFNTARNSVTNRLYVINGNATIAGGSDALPGFVSVIDGATNQVIANVPVGPLPFQGIAVNEVTNKIYVGSGADGPSFPASITVIDGVSHATQQVDLSQIPQTFSGSVVANFSFSRDIVVNPLSNKIYARISGGSTATMAVINGNTNVATALPNAYGSINIHRVNPQLNRVYISGVNAAGVNQLHVLDGTSDATIATLNVGNPTNHSSIQSNLAVDRTTGRVYITDYLQDTLSVIDGSSNTVIATLAVGDGPSAVTVDENANRIYVGNTTGKSLTIIDGLMLRVVQTIALPVSPLRVDVDPTNHQVYIQPILTEPGVVIVQDPMTAAPSISNYTQGAHGAVTMNGDGSLSYTAAPGYTGSDSYTYTVSDGNGGSSSATVHVNVVGTLAITTASLPDSTVGTIYTQTMAATGGTGSRTWVVSSGLMPGGITLNNVTGAITGTVRQNGTFTFTIQARDSGTPQQIASQSYTVNVGPPVITTTSLTTAFVNTPYSQQLTVAGATGATTWSINKFGQPALNWLSVSPAGLLSGTPPVSGTMPSFTVSVTDSLNQTATRLLPLTVGGPLDVEPLREGIVLESMPALSLVGGNGTRAVTMTGGALPPGLLLQSNGSFTGTPQRHGTFNFTVQVQDCQPSSGAATCLNTTTPQTITRNLTLRSSAKEQQGSSTTGTNTIQFGGNGGRRLAQIFTVGANGSLTGFGLQNLACSITPTVVSVDIQRVTIGGVPNGTTIATGSTANSGYFNGIVLTPAVDVVIGERLAAVVSAPNTCTFSNASLTDQYNAGDAYADAGTGNWSALSATDGKYDIPSFRSLIQPATDVGYNNLSHSAFTAVKLKDGRVLMVGGSGNNSAEIYDPATNTATLTTGSANAVRSGAAAVLLLGGVADGTVLIAGGRDANSNKLATAETFNPATGTFTATTNNLSVARDNLRAVRLNDGRVLITGGTSPTGTTGAADIYDPVSRSFTALPNMGVGRQSHAMVLLASVPPLASDKVLIVGGYTSGSGPSAELFNPSANTFSATTGSMQVGSRGNVAAALLQNGKVLIAGGQNSEVKTEAEIYDPATGLFTATGAMANRRMSHTATTLDDGSVLIAGGFEETSIGSYSLPQATLERYMPGSGTFVSAGTMVTRRQSHSAVLLDDNRVLLAGGGSQSWMSGNTTETFDRTSALTISPTTLADSAPNVQIPAVVFSGAGGQGAHTISFAGGVLPPGLNYDQATRTLFGTPTTAGRYTFSLRITDQASHVNVQTFTMKIGTVHSITTDYRLTDAATNRPYFFALQASGQPPVQWAIVPNAPTNQLPPGLFLNSNGTITGTAPASTGFYNFAVRAIDAQGAEAIKTHAISVQSPMTITTTSLSDQVAGNTLGTCISRSNGVAPYTWAITGGTLPLGTAFVNGTTSSTPSNVGCFDSSAGHVIRQIGNFSATIQVTDSSNPPQVVSQSYSFKVHALEQTTNSENPGVSLSFGGNFPGAPRLAQVFTAGSLGTLVAAGATGISCPANTQVAVDIRSVTASGLPDVLLASGSATSNYSVITFSTPPLEMTIGRRFAVQLSANASCSISGAMATDNYQAGDGFISTNGGPWVPLFNSTGRYDVPTMRTMITPALPVVYANQSHSSATATLLDASQNFKVLVTGGSGSNALAEIYDPATNQLTATGTGLVARSNHTAVRLNNGKVLIVGGRDTNGNTLSSAEVYDPSTGQFQATSNSMLNQREYPVAVLLSNNKVLIAGGQSAGGGNALQSTELYDPSSNSFSNGGNMVTARQNFVGVALANGNVLLAGGYGGTNASAEIYDPIAGTFTQTAGPMVSWRGRADAVLLDNGKVLIAGGTSADVLSTAELFDPISGTFTATAGTMSTPRHTLTATKLADGSVLIAGGYDENTNFSYVLPLASMERYIPGTDSFVPAGELETRRQNHAAVRLANGKVFVVGGYSQSWLTGNTGELYDPAAALVITPTTLANATAGVFYSQSFNASGGTGPYAMTTFTNPPAALGFDQATRTLSGTPATNGRFPFTLKVTDSLGRVGFQSYKLTVGASTLTTITSPYRLPDASVNAAYSYALAATPAGPMTWTVLPGGQQLPPGLNLSTSGQITGTPTVQGYTQFGVRAVDASGVEAMKTLSINVLGPMSITTNSLPDGIFAGGYGGCLSTTNGVGAKTFSLFAGSLPRGVTLSPSGCFSGVVSGMGTSNFTVRVTDQGTVPQSVNKALSINVALAIDQASSWDPSQPTLRFGGSPAQQVGQRVITGVSGTLRGVRIYGNSFCSNGTNVSVQIQGVAANGGPDGQTVATGNAVYPFDYIALDTPVFYAADQPFTLVLDASASCNIRPSTFDSIPGEGYLRTGSWQRLRDTSDARYDIGFETLVEPSAGLGFMSAYRSRPVSTRLANGKVLVISQQAADLYDPLTGVFTPTGNPTTWRQNFTATLLNDGTVLVAGGYNFSGPNDTVAYLSSAELYDPAAGTFTAIANMTTARSSHTATKLADGSVLIAGGRAASFLGISSAEIYTPGSGFAGIGQMAGARYEHTATLLDDERVLIAGGSGSLLSSQSAEIYTPGSGFALSANQMVAPYRGLHTATKLQNGLVLIAGGYGSGGLNAEIFDPSNETFTTNATLTVPRFDHTASLMDDGSVILSGGLSAISACCDRIAPLASVEKYQYGFGFSNAGNLLVSRYAHSGTVLTNNTILFAGTSGNSVAGGRLSEIYDPATAVALDNLAAPQGQSNVAYAGFTLSAHGGTGPYTITQVSGVLPQGLSYNPGTRTISGTPTQSGTFTVSFRVTDSLNHSNTQPVTIRIDALVITTASLPNAYVNQAYNAPLAATGVGAKTWSIVSGNLPPGLTIGAPGAISGTPTASGIYNFTVRAVDSVGQSATRNLFISSQNAMTITTASIPDGIAGQQYFWCFSNSNGTWPYTWSASGIPGLTFPPGGNCLANNYPAGTIRQTGPANLTVTVTDSANPPQVAARNFPVKFHGIDQWTGSQTSGPITLDSSVKIAQVFRAATPYGLSAIQLSNVSCTPGTVIDAWAHWLTPTGQPDDGPAPFALMSATADATGYFNSVLPNWNTFPIPQGARFAVAVKFTGGSCTGTNWPVDDFFPQGEGWIKDATGWHKSSAAIGRADVPIALLVTTDNNVRFLQTGRSGHSAVTLTDGRVLLLGGDATLEIYDPVSHTISHVANTMVQPRHEATATLLSNGKVLIAGGYYWSGPNTITPAQTEIFDPSDGSFSPGANLPTPRYGHVATRLQAPGNKVLITGGWTIDINNNRNLTDQAVLFSADGTSAVALSMTGARTEHSATLLNDGRVLIAGGWTGTPVPPHAAELYDPSAGGANGQFVTIDNPMVDWTAMHTATLVTSGAHAGSVLIAGGINLTAPTQWFVPGTMSFVAGPSLLTPRYDHTATMLSNGRIVMAGGSNSSTAFSPLTSVEVYDPVSDQFQILSDLPVDSQAHTANLITTGPHTGKIAIAGGMGTGLMTSRALKLYNPSSADLMITTTTLPDGAVGDPYSVSLAAAGGSGTGYTYFLPVQWGTLPPGLTLSSNGTISGNPEANAYSSFVVRVTDSANNTAYRSFTIAINRLTIEDSLPWGTPNTNYSHQMAADGGVGTVTWSVQCCMPAGFTLTPQGVLSGSSAAPNSWYLTFRAVDEVGQVALKTLRLEIIEPLALVPPPPTIGLAGDPYNVGVNAINATGNLIWSLTSGALPPGLSLQAYPMSASIAGTPSRTGMFSVTVQAMDSREPPQVAQQPVAQRVLAVEQRIYGQVGSNLSIHSSQSLAQTITARAGAPLYAVRADISCQAGSTLSLNVLDVDGIGRPGSTQYATASFPTVPASHIFEFPSPVFFPDGAKLALMFSTPGNCVFNDPNVNEVYPGGGAFFSTGGGWSAIPGYQDLPVETMVDLPDVQFSAYQRFTTHLNESLQHTVVVSGNDPRTSFYDAATRVLTDNTQGGHARQYGTATTLANGKILFAGGRDGNGPTANAEIYDPSDNSFTNTGGSMLSPRQRHTATLLASGRVLIAGGESDFGQFLRGAELYDPATNQFYAAGDMESVRILHQATLLPGGNVLVTGGASDAAAYHDAEIFTPGVGNSEGTFTAVTAPMIHARMDHRDVLLSDGRVLITGGQLFSAFAISPTMEVYDPDCPCFEDVPSMTMARARHTATRLGDGRVVIAGGFNTVNNGDPLSSIEIVDVENAFATRAAGSMHLARAGHAALAFCPEGSCAGAGQVVFAGGALFGADMRSVEAFDPAADTLPSGAAGQFYSAGVPTAQGPGNSYQVVAGSLPGGLSLNSANGAITGTPSTAGVSTFTVRIGFAGSVNYSFKTVSIEIVSPPVSAGPGDILISEVRGHTGGPSDFVEVYNNTDFDITVQSPSPSTGWALVESGGYQLLYIPNGTVIKARSHYLGSEWYGSANPIPEEPMVYAGVVGVRPQGTQAWGYFDGHRVAADRGVALFNTTVANDWIVANRLDAVGFVGENALYREGAGLPPTGALSNDYAWVRKMDGVVAHDSLENDQDFDFVSVTAGTYGGVSSTLGASGAEHSNAPIRGNSPGGPGLRMTPIDPLIPENAGPNLSIDPTPQGANAPNGTIEFRRTLINDTGRPITRLRLRVNDISTSPQQPGAAEFRVLSASNGTVSISGVGAVPVVGATLDVPPTQANGGGRNSSLSIAIPGGTLAPGARIHVRFRLGIVEPGGQYRFVLDVPGGAIYGVIP